MATNKIIRIVLVFAGWAFIAACTGSRAYKQPEILLPQSFDERHRPTRTA